MVSFSHSCPGVEINLQGEGQSNISFLLNIISQAQNAHSSMLHCPRLVNVQTRPLPE